MITKCANPHTFNPEVQVCNSQDTHYVLVTHRQETYTVLMLRAKHGQAVSFFSQWQQHAATVSSLLLSTGYHVGGQPGGRFA